ncbi:MAG: hypothetical protein EPO68_18175 [Planctomycetota bacterium]|nr:MAG: hypothetical protein EPO68_18175 [Planctomycetota bacterium]
MTRAHVEQHEPWLVEAIDGRLDARDERRAALADCEVCAPLLADMEALRDGLDDAGRLERDVLAEVSGARESDAARRGAAQARAAIAQLAAPPPSARSRRWLVPLAIAATLALAAYWITTHWRAGEPAPAPSVSRPQLGGEGVLRALTVTRGADGALELAWEAVDDAASYDVELFADESATGAPLFVSNGLAEPRCAVPSDQVARLPARVTVRVQPWDVNPRRLSPLRASFQQP